MFKKNEIIIALCTWFAAASALVDSLNSIALYLVLPLAFLFSFKKSSFKPFTSSIYFRKLVWLYFWILISVLWTTYTDVAMRQINQILGSFILCYIFVSNCKSTKSIIFIYLAYILLLGSAWHYASKQIFTVIDVGKDRLNDAKLNANTLAYYTFYVTFAIFIMGEMVKGKLRKRVRLLFFSTIFISFYTAILTASRQVLLIQIPFITILLYLRYMYQQKSYKKVLFIVTSVVAFMVMFPMIFDYYANSTLQSRSEVGFFEDIRWLLVMDSFNVGIEHFPLGVGPDNYHKFSFSGHFSHNNYLELFANEGIIGLFIYLSLMYVFVKKQWDRFSRTSDKVFLYFFIFGIFYIVDGVFYAFYSHLWLIGFFFLVASHSELYYIQMKSKLLK